MNIKKLDAILSSSLNNMGNSMSYDKVTYTSLEADDVRQLLNTTYSQAYDAFKKGAVLYRGDDDLDVFYEIGTPRNRISANTTNIYTRLFSGVLDSWKSYPKRNASFICSTDYGKANNYTDWEAYAVFPKNDSKIGICPYPDIWDSFGELESLDVSNLSKFNNIIETLLDTAKTLDGSFRIADFVNDSDIKIKKCLQDFDNIIYTEIGKSEEAEKEFFDKCEYTELGNSILTNILSGNSTYNLLNELLDPKNNDFKLITTARLASLKDANKEVWIGNECLFIVDYKLGEFND